MVNRYVGKVVTTSFKGGPRFLKVLDGMSFTALCSHFIGPSCFSDGICWRVTMVRRSYEGQWEGTRAVAIGQVRCSQRMPMDWWMFFIFCQCSIVVVVVVS